MTNALIVFEDWLGYWIFALLPEELCFSWSSVLGAGFLSGAYFSTSYTGSISLDFLVEGPRV